jgi:hypothetical protein
MRERPILTSQNTTAAIREYIKELEGALYGLSRLEQELRLVCDDWAEKLADLRSKENLIGEKKHHDWVISLLREVGKIKALNNKKAPARPATESSLPIDDEDDEPIEPVQKRITNIQDVVIQNDNG